MKKLILGILSLAVIGIAVLFVVNGKSTYDPSKFSLTIEPESKPFGEDSTISFVLPDQFGKPHTLSKDTERLIFVFTKQTGHTFKSYMSDKPKGFLSDRKTVAIADISGMPTVIINTFALPDFRKSSYTILLIYEKDMAKRLKEDQNTDKIVIMNIKENRVVDIEYAQNEKELGEILER